MAARKKERKDIHKMMEQSETFAEIVFADPDSLTPSERVIILNTYRAKVLNDEPIDEKEIRHAILLIRAERRTSTAARKKDTAKKADKPEVVPGSSLSAF